MTTSISVATPIRLRALQVAAALQLLNVGFQYVTAGELFPRGGPERLHAGGALLLHVVGLAALVAAVLHWRQDGGPRGLAVLAAVVLVAGIVQAATGGRETLWIHVPGAMVLTLGAGWLVGWAVTTRTGRNATA